MDDSAIERFFREPVDPAQRKFEALRAVFLEHRSLKDVAQQFGYHYGSMRNLVSAFRAQHAAGALPPFSRHQPWGGPAAARTTARNQILRRSPTSDCWA